jgi:hypothetical protein
MGLLDQFEHATSDLYLDTKEYKFPYTSSGHKQAKAKVNDIHKRTGFRPHILKVTPKHGQRFYIVVETK